MRTLSQWFDEYSESHKNETNIALHYICVPAIFFSIFGLLTSIPSQFLQNLIPGNIPLLENWAIIGVLIIFIFYIRLSVSTAIAMTAFAFLCILLSLYIKQFTNLALVCFIIFVIAWIGQFYGHKIEGKKPSFLKDIQFLLIGPAWIFYKLTN